MKVHSNSSKPMSSERDLLELVKEYPADVKETAVALFDEVKNTRTKE